MEEADVRGAGFAPLDSAYMPWEGIKAETLRGRLQDQPDDAQGWYELGRLLAGLHRASDAVEAFDRALALNPDFSEALYFRGIVLQEAGDLPGALSSIERAVADDHLKHVWTQYPQLLLETGREEEALAAAHRLVERFEKAPIAWRELGAVLRALGRGDEADLAEERAERIRLGSAYK